MTLGSHSFITVSSVGVRPEHPLALLTTYKVSAIVYLPLEGTHRWNRWIKLGCERPVMHGPLSGARDLVDVGATFSASLSLASLCLHHHISVYSIS
jgi:hypothetical protein